MGSLRGDWPSFDPNNFSQLRPTDPSIPSRIIPATYCATHDQTVPPPNQVIHTERKNILIRKLHQKAEQKLRLKRGASDHPIQEHGCKQPKSSCGDA